MRNKILGKWKPCAAALLACGMIFAGAGQAGAASIHIAGPHTTFYKLSTYYGVPMDALLAANPGVDPHNVYAGLRLTIPDAGAKNEAAASTMAALTTASAKASGTTLAAKSSEAGTQTIAAASAAAIRQANIAAAVPGQSGQAPEVYFKTFEASATAYTAAHEENGWGPVDYFGNPLALGTVAVDPKVIALGTKLYIEGYRYDGLPAGSMYAIARDTGSAIKGKRIDIFVPDSRKQAMTFGIQNVRVYML